MAQVHAHFRPEFVNRVDEFVVFQPLQLGQIKQIVRLQVRRAPRKGDSLGITDPSFLTTCIVHAEERASAIAAPPLATTASDQAPADCFFSQKYV